MARTSRKSNGTATSRRAPRMNGTAQRNANGNGDHLATPARSTAARLPILKTYKIYIGGKFPRTESGRFYLLKNSSGNPIANMCLSSRKDFREAVVAARAAQPGWAK